jgi:hypothetical protein
MRTVWCLMVSCAYMEILLWGTARFLLIVTRGLNQHLFQGSC